MPTTTATFSQIRNGAPAQCSAACEKEAEVRDWSVICETESTKCGACQQCIGLETVVCPRGWFSHKGHCYTVHHTEMEFGIAQAWCQAHGADLVSVNSEWENHFLWRICGTGTHNPLLYPLLVKRGVCWLGLTEEGGDKNTPPLRQKWRWADGMTTDGYSNWRRSPHGASYDEPNNGRDGPNQMKVSDERTAVMNDPSGSYSGKWYDKPANTKALPACEMRAETASRVAVHHQTAKKTEALPSIGVVRNVHGGSLRGSR